MSFSQWLRREIENRKMTIGQFAEKCGLSREHLTRIVNGRLLPVRGLTIVKIADGLAIEREKVESRLRAA